MRLFLGGVCFFVSLVGLPSPSGIAQQRQERRSMRPTFDGTSLDNVFFESVEAAFEGSPPTLASLRAASRSAAEPTQSERDDASGAASTLVSASTLESEVKRIKLRFDSNVSSPGAFKGGGFQDARVDLTVLAMLMAVISEYDGDVRWKDEAAAARSLLAKSATNVRAGTTTTFREAQQRRGDLQSLMSGSGVPKIGEIGENDWSEIADRMPLMSYFEELIERMESESYDADAIKENEAGTRRDAEMLALLGDVLTRQGMDSADDEDYCVLSRDMTKRARGILTAIDSQNFAAAEAAVNSLRESCDNCHQDYR